MTEQVPRMWESSAEAKKAPRKPRQAGHSTKCLNVSVLPLYLIDSLALYSVRLAVCPAFPCFLLAHSVSLRESEGILILALGGKLTLPRVSALPKVYPASLSLALVQFDVLCAWWACQTVHWCPSSLRNFLNSFWLSPPLYFLYSSPSSSVIQKLDCWFHCSTFFFYRHTLQILQVWFQTIAIKQMSK